MKAVVASVLLQNSEGGDGKRRRPIRLCLLPYDYGLMPEKGNSSMSATTGKAGRNGEGDK